MNGFPNQSNYCLQGKLHHDLVLICVQRLSTSTYKPARLGKSLLLGLSRRSGQTYFTFSITSFAATSPVLTGATSA
ncbi:hypothetical protein EB18_01307 [Enterococcus cecorum]|uniref:Uncharacterized protein n=1 Tax=Enterococcus cecorum TaxID=44008 RepID=A0A366SFW9_9ENTE|nr:hypothetical protein EB18_01307 [Enterococcus cecorum]